MEKALENILVGIG